MLVLGTIVIVDDDPAMRTWMRLTLQREQFDVLDFPSPLDALTTLQDTSVEISAVISDIDMPGMDGIAFASTTAITSRIEMTGRCGLRPSGCWHWRQPGTSRSGRVDVVGRHRLGIDFHPDGGQRTPADADLSDALHLRQLLGKD